MPEVANRGEMGQGIFIAAVCNLVGLGLAFYLTFIFTSIFFSGFGITQVLWLGPLWNHYKKKRETEEAKGVLVIAGMTLLLNAACWSMVR